MSYKIFNEKYEDILNDDFLNEILWLNGIKTKEDYAFFNGSVFPFSFNHSNEFISMIDKHKNGKIIIIGDYDCDGVCATTIMLKFFQKINIKCDYIIGDRVVDGYGMNNNLIDKAMKKNATLIICVDNGIKCKESVSYAQKNNLDVIVTDHHLPLETHIPSCLIFNPHYQNEHLKFHDVCGAFVAFTLIYYYSRNVVQLDKDFMYELYELSALATIGDVMPLTNINRKIVKMLVSSINQNSIRNKGIKSLCETLKLNEVTSTTIAYKIIPIINAPGRLSTSDLAVDLLLNGTSILECIDYNEQRKSLTQECMANIKIDHNEKVNVVFFPNLNEGIIGIIAGAIKERTKKPTFVFTSSDSEIKGSGRSIKGYNMLVEAEKIILKYDISNQYGGHEGAMGLTIKNKEDYLLFKKEINASFPLTSSEEIVYYLPYKYDTIEKGHHMCSLLEPYGQEFVCPPFSILGDPLNIKYINDLHTSFQIKVERNFLQFIAFNQIIKDEKEFFFTIDKSFYNNRIFYKGNIQKK